MIIEITGNIVDFKDAQYIAHQCNCVSESYSGLAHTIFNKYVYANTYIDKEFTRTPGDISIHGDGDEQRFVINMYAQYYPGKPNASNDSYINRIGWFRSCMIKMLKIDSLKSIAFPYKIGCGLAGGSWDDYFETITIFAQMAKKLQVYIVKIKE